MADYGDIGLVTGWNTYSGVINLIPYPDKRITLTETSFKPPINNGSSITQIKYPQYYVVPWVMTARTDTFTVQCELFNDSIYASTAKPTAYVDGFMPENFAGEGVSGTGLQDVEVSYTLPLDKPIPYVVNVYLAYYNQYSYEIYCQWFIASTNGIMNLISSGGGGGGGPSPANNCSYPIGEEKPIAYGDIEVTASNAYDMTFTIPAGTVASATTDAQILITLSPYGSNAFGTIEDIFASLGGNWFQLYAMDGTTSLRIDVETWRETDDFARIWITIPELDTISKDIVLQFSNIASNNPDAHYMNVIGF